MVSLSLELGLGIASVRSFDVDALALFDAMTTPPTASRQVLLNDYIGALKSARVWDKLDILYLTAAATDQAARLNLKDPAAFALVDVVAPTFEADRGFTGNGSTQALSTQWNPSTQAVQFTQDNASMWVWCTTDVAENAADIGAAVTHNSFIRARSAGNTISMTLNGATTSTSAIATSVGMTGISRADGTTQRIWKNGVEQGTGFAGDSTGLPTQPARLCGRYNDLFSTKQIAFGAFGASLTAAEALALYNATLSYLQGVGAA